MKFPTPVTNGVCAKQDVATANEKASFQVMARILSLGRMQTRPKPRRGQRPNFTREHFGMVEGFAMTRPRHDTIVPVQGLCCNSDYQSCTQGFHKNKRPRRLASGGFCSWLLPIAVLPDGGLPP